VLRVLGTELGLPGFEYQSSEEVCEALRRECGELAGGGAAALGYHGKHRLEAASEGGAPVRVVDVPMYQVDAIVRRAGSLQRTVEGRAEPATY
jgi:NADH-quinone oxidoreductase subunit G